MLESIIIILEEHQTEASHVIKKLDKNGLITGVALGITATAIMPIMKSTILGLGVIGVKGAMKLVEGTKLTLILAKEEIEDIIAEAQFERLKSQLDEEINLLPKNQ